MTKTKDLHARALPPFYEEVHRYARSRGVTISDLIITSLRHEMYGHDDYSLAIQALSKVLSHVEDERNVLESMSHPSNVTQTVAQTADIAQGVAQMTTTVAQESVDYSKIEHISQIQNLEMAVGFLKYRSRFVTSEKEGFVDNLAKQCGLSLTDLTRAVIESGYDLKIIE